ncbi:MAG: hypothetical protein HFH74_09150 [Lachnospiraceae bacterium]|jgi:P2-related tail formation protein|nr:hypothetical protein [Lachnospiraceae bacterium]
MFQIDDVGSMYISLPPNLQDTENACFSYAFDKQIQKLYKLAKKLTVWSDLDNADPKYYDYMALAIRTPYYKSEYNQKQKLKLIKATLAARRYAGTVKAVEELLDQSILFAKFVPWYEYNGEPYHFKIKTSDTPEIESRILFGNMLQRVKAARSIIDGVEIDHDPIRNAIYIGVGIRQQKIIQIHNKEKFEYKICAILHIGCAVNVKKQIVIKGERNDEV